ncbi:hypothetical protein GCM10017687_34290 [Streptomyces echinatus]
MRTAGLGASFADGTDHFTGPDRSVAVNLMEDDVPGRAPEDFLAALMAGAPDKLPAQRRTEPVPGGLRYAFWLTPEDNGRPRHEFYGIHRGDRIGRRRVLHLRGPRRSGMGPGDLAITEP